MKLFWSAVVLIVVFFVYVLPYIDRRITYRHERMKRMDEMPEEDATEVVEGKGDYYIFPGPRARALFAFVVVIAITTLIVGIVATAWHSSDNDVRKNRQKYEVCRAAAPDFVGDCLRRAQGYAS